MHIISKFNKGIRFLLCFIDIYHCTKNYIFFFQMFWKHGFSKKIALEYDLSCIIRKDYISFSQNLILFLETKGKMIFLKKYLKIWRYFLQVFWKGGLSRKFAPDQDLFRNIWKDGICFFRKIWYFFGGRKMKEDYFYQKMRGNMVFSVYMRGRYKHNTGPPAKKQRCPCPKKIHLRVTSLASPKKMVFIVENMAFLLNYHVDWYPRKDPRSSHRRCSTKKGVLRNFSEPLF